MKITAFSDCHGHLPKITGDPDIICICGDICPTIDHSIMLQKEWLDVVFFKWCNDQKADILLVPGNHDFIFENREIMVLPPNLKILIDRTIEVNGIVFHGTPSCKIFGNWAFMKDPSSLIKDYEKIPDNVEILLCHDAPDLNEQGVFYKGPLRIDAGNVQLAQAILRSKPRYVLHGHIHQSPRENESDGIKIHNVSIKDDRYVIVNEPLTFEYY